jgi:hypothetical protein
MFVGVGIGVGRQRFAGGFDADYQAILNYATSLGYTLPSARQQVKQNQLVLDLKAGGIWSKLDTFRVYATDGSSSYALIDWKRLSLCTAINSPTFTTNQGYSGNGTSSYIDTNFNPNTPVGANNYKLENASVGAWVFVVGGNGLLGANNSSNLSLRNTSSGQQRINSGNTVTAVDLSGTGLKSANKTSSTNYTMFNNLTSTSGIVNSAGINDTITDFKAVGTLFFSGITSISYAGASLVAEHTDLYNAFNTYMTSL